MTDILKYFQIEAREHLEGLSSGLLELERSGGSADALKTLFRLAHTLKGSARMVGQSQLSAVAHKMEDVLGAIQAGQVEVTDAVINAMLAATDIIGQMVEHLMAEPSAEVDVAPVLSRLSGAVAAAPQPAAPRPVEEVRVVQPAAPEPVAAAAAARPEPQPREATAPVQAVSQALANDEQFRVSTAKVNYLVNLTGELLIHKSRLSDHALQMRQLAQETLRILGSLGEFSHLAKLQEIRSALAGTPQGEALLTFLSRHDGSVFKESIRRLISESKGQVAQLEQLSTVIHERMMDLRMLPAATVLTPFHRLVRDTAQSLGRAAKLQVIGGEIEVDKGFLEGLKEPLGHMLNNAVAHGIEPADVRGRLGKPEEGTVSLSFARRGATLTVSVEDDGRGIDVERVRQVAISRGDLSEELSQSARPVDLFKLLMKPGFTTARGVSEIAGRGVGMDVVATRIKALKGSIDICSTAGRGTRIDMRFPVNMSLMDGFVFMVDGQNYVVPLENVWQVYDLATQEMDLVTSHQVLNVEKQPVPYAPFLRLLGRHADYPCPTAVVLKAGGDHFAVGVERLIGVRTLIVKPLSPHLGEMPWVSGMTILAGGDPAPIIDVTHVFGLAGSLQTEGASAVGCPRLDDAPARPEPARRTVLVVDDSLSARLLTQGMLEAAGYTVLLGSDGEEGLGILSARPVDVVVSDVEMPRMNGFDMVRRIRENPATRAVPVIIISSLDTEQDKQRGMESGADAYLVKGHLDQAVLVGAVGALVREPGGR